MAAAGKTNEKKIKINKKQEKLQGLLVNCLYWVLWIWLSITLIKTA